MVKPNFLLALSVLAAIISLNCWSCNAGKMVKTKFAKNEQLKTAVWWMKRQVQKLKRKMSESLISQNPSLSFNYT